MCAYVCVCVCAYVCVCACVCVCVCVCVNALYASAQCSFIMYPIWLSQHTYWYMYVASCITSRAYAAFGPFLTYMRTCTFLYVCYNAYAYEWSDQQIVKPLSVIVKDSLSPRRNAACANHSVIWYYHFPTLNTLPYTYVQLPICFRIGPRISLFRQLYISRPYSYVNMLMCPVGQVPRP